MTDPSPQHALLVAEGLSRADQADLLDYLPDGAAEIDDIARRIVVERHGGTITIDSRPGETVLRVRIPVRPPVPPGRTAS